MKVTNLRFTFYLIIVAYASHGNGTMNVKDFGVFIFKKQAHYDLLIFM